MQTRKEEKLVIDKIKSGDKNAYQIIVETYQQRLFAVAFGILKNQDDAEEVTQEAFVKAYNAIHKFKGDSSIYTWLYRITHNMAIDVKRKLNRRGYEKDIAEPGIEGAIAYDKIKGNEKPSPYKALQLKQEKNALQDALMSLSDDHRGALLLREVDGFSYDEIANTLEISRGTVMSRIFYARKKLLELVGGIEAKKNSEIIEENDRTGRQKEELLKFKDSSSG